MSFANLKEVHVRDVRIALAASLTVGCLLGADPGRARAAPVEPGGSVAITGETFVAPTGEVVASDTQTVTLDYILDPLTPDTPTSFDITFNSQVLRDPMTQRLTFVYQLQEAPAVLPDLLTEQTSFSLSNFTGFSTDVTSTASFDLSRSADGSTLQATDADVASADLPTFAVATDATAFDANGIFSGTIVGDTLDPLGGPITVDVPFAVAGAFQPILDDDDGGGVGGDGGGDGDDGGGDGGGGGGAGGTPIPLPAGVWAGLIALAGTGTLTRFRRKLRLI